MNREMAKRTLDILFYEVFGREQAHLMAGLVSGFCIQHDPLLAKRHRRAGGLSEASGELAQRSQAHGVRRRICFRACADPNWMGKEYAGVDIFRFDASAKIVEHRDVMQEVPATSANENGIF